jgi:SAM-dependent methyltransferase
VSGTIGTTVGDVMRFRKWARGALSYLPGFEAWASTRAGGGGTLSARYCYGVWMRHLTLGFRSGLSRYPEVVAEVGPGSSIGIGLAALLCGSRAYYALDVIGYADQLKNLEVLDGLVELFQARAPIPDADEFPDVGPVLDSYRFPSDVLSDERLRRTLEPERVEDLRRDVMNLGRESQGSVRYMTSWHEANSVGSGTVDFLLSQAVLEHVDDLEAVYSAMRRWLKEGALMSHQIDFRSHATSREWNGHWGIGDLSWRVMRGRRAYFLNRAPYAIHQKYLRDLRFNVVTERRTYEESGLVRVQLAPRFRGISDDDLRTAGVFVQALKA